jgi:hypothetical protein
MSLDALTLGAGNTLFISERRTPLERINVCKMVNTFAKAAGLSELNVHPHMLKAFLRVRSGEPRAAFKGISGTGTSSTLCDTRNCHQPALQICTKGPGIMSGQQAENRSSNRRNAGRNAGQEKTR